MDTYSNLYDASHVRIEKEPLENDQSPYAPPASRDTRDAQANPELRSEFAPGIAKIRVIPMMAFVFIGLMLGHFFISSAIFPPSRHVLQQFRGAAIGALLGVLMYAMMEYFFPRED
jgi:hypothetical protein